MRFHREDVPCKKKEWPRLSYNELQYLKINNGGGASK
jgi:hypothetical protein